MTSRLSLIALSAAFFAMSLGHPAEARDGRGRGHDRDDDRRAHVQHRRGDDRRDRRIRRDDDRHRYVVIRDDDRRIRNYQPQAVWRSDDRWHDGRNRRYHPQSGKWDNGRRGPPSWARGRDYRSYGYDRIVYVPYQDYRRYDLYAPRDGYRWVRDDAGHYLLVALATGIISDVLYRHSL